MRLISVIVCLFLAISAVAQRAVALDSLREGDLLFVVTPQANAITQVTRGVEEMPIDHVAIFHWRTTDSIATVLQAIGKGVVMEPLDSLRSEAGKGAMLLVGRVNADLDAHTSLTRAMTLLGKPYDYYYGADDKEIYCSELVQKSYVDHAGRPIFTPIPMTFRDKQGRIPDYWTRLYAARGLAVPEGAPGSNPGDLSRRPVVTLLGFLQP